MLTYKNHLKELAMPEYGRNIQNMVEHCITIEDREERTRCARSIIDAMSILFPAQGGDQQAHRRKLWDHLALISDFKLDVDIPFELLGPKVFEDQPQPVTRSEGEIRRRQYGHLIELMIEKCAEMGPGEERTELAILTANHMKKLMTALNPEGVEDVKIFKDLYDMSEGRVALYPAEVKLYDYKMAQAPAKKKRKK